MHLTCGSVYLPISAEGEKIKIREFNFELTFNVLICDGLSQCSHWVTVTVSATFVSATV